jgi:hypothetical protein
MLFNYFFNQINQEWRTRRKIIFSSSGRIMIPQIPKWNGSIAMRLSRSISKKKKMLRSTSITSTYLHITCTASSARIHSRYT